MKRQSIIVTVLIIAALLFISNAVGARSKPNANAGLDQTITLPTNTVTLTGSGTDADGTITSYAWKEMSGPNTAQFSSKTTATTTVSNLIVGTYKFRLTVKDNSGSSDSDDVYVTVSSSNGGGGGTGSSPYGGTAWAIPGTIQAEDYDLGGEGVGYHDTDANNATGVYRPTEGVDLEPVQNDSGGYNVGWIAVGEWMNYTVNVQSSGTYSLNARVAASYSGNFHLEIDGTSITTVSVPATGGYQSWQTITVPGLSLQSGKHTMRVVIDSLGYNLNYFTFTASTTQPGNQLPVANAGADQAVTLPTNSATLSGSGTDSDGTIVSYGWSQTAGPNTATIGSASNASTTVSNLIAGTYTFTLKVTDNQGASATDTVNIVVSSAANVAPTANAGIDQTVTLPTNTTALTGSGTDTDGTIASYAWSQVSGPNTATIGSAASASTTVSNLIAGTYSFRLKVTDNAGATATDDVSVVVISAPVNPPTVGSPYGGTAWAVPGTIQAEDYDLGGEGVGYHDADTNNQGQKYRNEGVDITTTFDVDGGYTVGWTAAGEWTNYTINVKTTGNYVVQARVASAYAAGSLRVDIDGAQVATVPVPVTGGWEVWQTISVLNVPLTQGTHVMRVTNINGGNNINYFIVTDNAAPLVDAGKDQTVSLPTNSVNLSGSASDPDGTIASYKWTKVSGGAATITNSTSTNTTVTGLEQGPYIFRLTATDNKGKSSSDDMSVTVYGLAASRIAINPDTMVINDNAVGDETKLFDEQGTLQIDANGNPIASTTNPIACPNFWNEPRYSHACWSMFDTGGIRDIVWPATLTIDLKATHSVSDIYVFIESASTNGAEDDFEIRASDDPFNFTNKIGGTKFQTAAYPYMQWVRIPLGANNNRYLQLKITSGAGIIGEVVLYGNKTGQTVADNTPTPVIQPQHYTMDKLIGTNVSWGMGDGYDKDYDIQWGTLRTYSGLRWIFDKFDNLQLGNPGEYSYDLLRRQLDAGTGEKPYNVEMGASLSMADPNDPNYSNSSFSDRKPIDYTLCQGTMLINNIPSCHGIADKPESYAHKAALLKKLAESAYGPTNGLFKEEFIETGNEPDGSWNGAGYFTPYELAAMMSADYDGHCDTLRYNGEHVGIKNGDPALKVIMPGVVAMGSGDMRYLKAMNFWWQHHRSCSPTIPTDAINFHFYSSSSGGQGSATGIGISPEDYGMREMMKKTVDFRNKFAPKADVAVTEFGYDSYPQTFPTDGPSWCQGATYGGSIIAAPNIGPYSTDEVQGQWITRTYLEMAAAGIDFANQFWVADEYKLNTVCGTFAASGLVKQVLDAINWRPQYTPRPGWYYVQTLKTQLKGMKYESDHDVNGVRVMKFRNESDTRKVAYVVWSPTSTAYVNSSFSVPFDKAGIATPVHLSVGSETGVIGTPTASAVSSVVVSASERPTVVLVTE